MPLREFRGSGVTVLASPDGVAARLNEESEQVEAKTWEAMARSRSRSAPGRRKPGEQRRRIARGRNDRAGHERGT